MAGSVDTAREAFAGRHWDVAVQELVATDGRAPLDPPDVERLATSYWMLGRTAETIAALARTHDEYERAGDTRAAARVGIWLAFYLLIRAQPAQCMGWAARSQRLLDELPGPTPEHALALTPGAFALEFRGDQAQAEALFRRALKIARPLGNPEVISIAEVGLAFSLVRSGGFDEALGLLDEAIAIIGSGATGPVAAGIVYCHAIECCHLAFDLPRAREWTAALDAWRMAEGPLVEFSGKCDAHRAELFRLHGAWDDAVRAAHEAQEKFRAGDFSAGFSSFYEEAEVLRLRGRYVEADRGYAEALRCGWDPLPGLALLRLDQGRPAEAQSLLRRSTLRDDGAYRRQLLAATVEVELAAGDEDAAAAAWEELSRLAEQHGTPWTRALEAAAAARVLASQGRNVEALDAADRAWSLWSELGVPYEVARCLVLKARACLALSDSAPARLGLALARDILAELGARPALDGLPADGGPTRASGGPTTPPAPPPSDAPLSARELDVLQLVCAGLSNQSIASQLFLSERTVAHHVGSILAKLGVPSRTAAAAQAFRTGLVAPGQK
ncbi:helix-turn-helix transcriptional regulator [Sinomonas sp. R1AF57]|uniref:helix-turn-helix transcriptional regulator n=1 Tax=Sinomonas sp. R1AF57 TaxID=2020377 RepID=UPI000B5EFD6A|nr:helix-turn-helix transcriptional regulator [Sinomonas sp. R1AF57]ASN51514.1 helix-turn-helix transcriptional regulator [Sinomonas sp. R1AF57]